jgi:c-di-GMP-related signal transduction protein
VEFPTTLTHENRDRRTWLGSRGSFPRRETSVDRFRERSDQRHPLHPHQGFAAVSSSEFRQFALQPIVGPNRQIFGSEALFRAGWEDLFGGDPGVASRIMLDNWLLFGFDELLGRRPVSLNCTRDTLMSGLPALLPSSAILEIPEQVEPDEEALLACRSLKAAGYRIALDDFASPEKMEPFLELADFIKVDFHHSGRRERAGMLRRLKLTAATLIAEQIECEEDFRQAVEEGFALFQGHYAGEHTTYVKKRDALDSMNCTRILEALQEPDFSTEEVAELIDRESGIECRLLRRANWAAGAGQVINSTREAIETVGRADLQKIVTLAMRAAAEKGGKPRSATRAHQPPYLKYSADNLVRGTDAGASIRWWRSERRDHAH